MPRLNRLLRLSLAALLLAAWQVALLHPIKHLNAGGGFVHVAGGDSHPDQKKKSAPDTKCDAIAALALCVAGMPAILPAADVPQASHPDLENGAAQHTALLAYRSQAPPQHS